MSEGPRLLDVFVNVRPDPEMLAAVKTAHETLITDLQTRISSVSTSLGDNTVTAIGRIRSAVSLLRGELQNAQRDVQNLNNGGGGGGGGGRNRGGGGGGGSSGGGGGQDATNQQISDYRNNLDLLKRANEVEIARATQAGGRQFALPFIAANREIKTLLIELDQLRDGSQSADRVAETFARVQARIQDSDEALRAFVVQQAQLRQSTPAITATLGGGEYTENIAADFRLISDAARESAVQAGRLSTSLSEIGDLALVDQIKILKQEFRDFESDLRRAKRDGTFDVGGFSDRLFGLRTRLGQIGGQSGASAQTKEQLVGANESLRASLIQDEITLRVQNELYVSRLDATEREIYVRRRGEYEKQKALVLELLKQRDNSLLKEQDINSALLQQKALLGELNTTFEGKAARTTATFNRLQNTAFQVGQAFEDFAVGFQLNGITGGIRGAANNISFIANDVVSIYTQSAKISEKWKLIAGVGTGIGAALAVTVLPPTIAWLESLNDISIEIEDISRKMGDMADESRRVAEANQKTRETLRGIGDADTFGAVLQQLRDLRQETEDSSKKVRDELGNLFSSTVIENMSSSFDPVLEQVQSQIASLTARAGFIFEKMKRDRSQADLLDLFGIAFGGKPGPKPDVKFEEALASATTVADKSAQDLLTTYQRLRQEIDNIKTALGKGIVDSDKIQSVSRLFETVSADVEKFSKTADISDETKNFAETFRKNIDPLRKSFEDLVKPLKEIEEVIQRRFSAAVNAAVQKTDQLADRQRLLRLQLQGQASEQSTALLDIREFSAEYEKLIAATLEFYAKTQGVTLAQVDRLRTVLRGQADLEIGNKNLTEQKSILERIQAAEERIASMRERSNGARRSQTISPEEFGRQLQQNVLSIDPLDKNTDALLKATNELIELQFELVKLQALEQMRVTRGAIGDFGFGFLPAMERALPFMRAPRAEEMMFRGVPGLGGFGGATGMLDVFGAMQNRPSNISEMVGAGVEVGIRRALEGLSPELFNRIEGVTDAVKTKDMSPRAQ